MKEEERAAIISYRLKRAQETYDEVVVLADSGFWHAAVSRLYYAVFYSANALLAAHGQSAKTHKGTRMAFSLLITETDLISRDRTKVYHSLFEFRHNSDYDDFVDMDQSRVEPLMVPAKELIDAIERVVNDMGIVDH